MDWWSKLFWATGDADKSLQYKYKSYHTLTVRVLGKAAHNLPWEGSKTWPWFVREPLSAELLVWFCLVWNKVLHSPNRSPLCSVGVDDLELRPSCLYLLGVSTANVPTTFSVQGSCKTSTLSPRWRGGTVYTVP